MRAAFAFVVVDPGRDLPAHQLDALRSPQPPEGMSFTAGAHVCWTNATDDALVAVWQEHPRSQEVPVWQADDDRFSVLVGEIRQVGRPWGPRTSWPGELEVLQRPGAMPGAVDRFAGTFAGGVMTSPGDGVVVNDPLGLRYLYHGRGDGWTVVASNPTLAAWLVSADGEPPVPDPLGVVGLAYSRYRITNRTGYVGVEVLPVGAYVELRSGRTPRVVRRPAVWLPDDEQRSLDRDTLLDRALAALDDNVRHADSFPTPVHMMDLTGGSDTRLSLAVALAGGLTGSLVFRSDGRAGLPDVEVARELAELFGLRWLHGVAAVRYVRERAGEPVDPDPSRPSWTDAVRAYVRFTAGMDNLWQVVRRYPDTGLLRLAGFYGERLRSSLRHRLPSEEHLLARIDHSFGELDLLLPEPREWYRACWHEEVSPGTWGIESREDRHDAFELCFQTRRNDGPRDELRRNRRIAVPRSLDAVRAVFALGPEERIRGAIHREAMRRADARLAEVPFVGAGLHDSVEEVPADPLPGVPKRRRVPASQRPVTNAAEDERARSGSAERIALYWELHSQRANPAWDLIDRAEFAAAVAQHDSLSLAAQQEVAGAATATLWLAEAPRRRR